MIRTLQLGREEMECRLAICAKSMSELKQKLTQFISKQQNPKGLYTGNALTMHKQAELLNEGEEGKHFIRKILEKGNIHKIAQLWESGITIDWKLMHEYGEITKIPMPTYPFSKTRHWLEHKNGKNDQPYVV